MRRILILGLCFLLILPFGCTAKKEPAAPAETGAPAEQTAPNGAFNTEMIFSGTTLDGDPIDQTIFESYDLIIVNCWAEWCGPCVGELPELERIHQEYPNVLILGVLSGTDSVRNAKDTLKSAGVTYPTLEASGKLAALSRRSQYIPATYFFDNEGHEIGSPIIGSQDYEGWKATVEEFLN